MRFGEIISNYMKLTSLQSA